MSIDTGLRPRTKLDAAYENVRANREEILRHSDLALAQQHIAGEFAALGWVLDPGAASPLTGRSGVDTNAPSELDRERRIATDMLYGKVPADGRGEAYISGVESTLMWILGETDSEPF